MASPGSVVVVAYRLGSTEPLEASITMRRLAKEVEKLLDITIEPLLNAGRGWQFSVNAEQVEEIDGCKFPLNVDGETVKVGFRVVAAEGGQTPPAPPQAQPAPAVPVPVSVVPSLPAFPAAVAAFSPPLPPTAAPVPVPAVPAVPAPMDVARKAVAVAKAAVVVSDDPQAHHPHPPATPSPAFAPAPAPASVAPARLDAYIIPFSLPVPSPAPAAVSAPSAGAGAEAGTGAGAGGKSAVEALLWQQQSTAAFAPTQQPSPALETSAVPLTKETMAVTVPAPAPPPAPAPALSFSSAVSASAGGAGAGAGAGSQSGFFFSSSSTASDSLATGPTVFRFKSAASAKLRDDRDDSARVEEAPVTEWRAGNTSHLSGVGILQTKLKDSGPVIAEFQLRVAPAVFLRHTPGEMAALLERLRQVHPSLLVTIAHPHDAKKDSLVLETANTFSVSSLIRTKAVEVVRGFLDEIRTSAPIVVKGADNATLKDDVGFRELCSEKRVSFEASGGKQNQLLVICDQLTPVEKIKAAAQRLGVTIFSVLVLSGDTKTFTELTLGHAVLDVNFLEDREALPKAKAALTRANIPGIRFQEEGSVAGGSSSSGASRGGPRQVQLFVSCNRPTSFINIKGEAAAIGVSIFTVHATRTGEDEEDILEGRVILDLRYYKTANEQEKAMKLLQNHSTGSAGISFFTKVLSFSAKPGGTAFYNDINGVDEAEAALEEEDDTGANKSHSTFATLRLVFRDNNRQGMFDVRRYLEHYPPIRATLTTLQLGAWALKRQATDAASVAAAKCIEDNAKALVASLRYDANSAGVELTTVTDEDGSAAFRIRGGSSSGKAILASLMEKVSSLKLLALPFPPPPVPAHFVECVGVLAESFQAEGQEDGKDGEEGDERFRVTVRPDASRGAVFIASFPATAGEAERMRAAVQDLIGSYSAVIWRPRGTLTQADSDKLSSAEWCAGLKEAKGLFLCRRVVPAADKLARPSSIVNVDAMTMFPGLWLCGTGAFVNDAVASLESGAAFSRTSMSAASSSGPVSFVPVRVPLARLFREPSLLHAHGTALSLIIKTVADMYPVANVFPLRPGQRGWSSPSNVLAVSCEDQAAAEQAAVFAVDVFKAYEASELKEEMVELEPPEVDFLCGEGKAKLDGLASQGVVWWRGVVQKDDGDGAAGGSALGTSLAYRGPTLPANAWLMDDVGAGKGGLWQPLSYEHTLILDAAAASGDRFAALPSGRVDLKAGGVTPAGLPFHCTYTDSASGRARRMMKAPLVVGSSGGAAGAGSSADEASQIEAALGKTPGFSEALIESLEQYSELLKDHGQLSQEISAAVNGVVGSLRNPMTKTTAGLRGGAARALVRVKAMTADLKVSGSAKKDKGAPTIHLLGPVGAVSSAVTAARGFAAGAWVTSFNPITLPTSKGHETADERLQWLQRRLAAAGLGHVRTTPCESSTGEPCVLLSAVGASTLHQAEAQVGEWSWETRT